MSKTFERSLTIPCFPEMEAQIRLAAKDQLTTPADYCRRALADRLAKDGYISSRPQ